MYEDLIKKARIIILKVTDILIPQIDSEIIVNKLLDTVNIIAMTTLIQKLSLNEQDEVKKKLSENKIGEEFTTFIKSKFTNTDLVVVYSKTLKQQLEKFVINLKKDLPDEIKRKLENTIDEADRI